MVIVAGVSSITSIYSKITLGYFQLLSLIELNITLNLNADNNLSITDTVKRKMRWYYALVVFLISVMIGLQIYITYESVELFKISFAEFDSYEDIRTSKRYRQIQSIYSISCALFFGVLTLCLLVSYFSMTLKLKKVFGNV